MEDALVLLRKGTLSPPDRLPSFPGIQEAVGFPVCGSCDFHVTR